MGEHVRAVTDDGFAAEVLEAEGPVLVDFWAPWCGPCRMLTPELEAFAAANAGKVKVLKLNTDENQATPVRYNIMSIPTLILFQGGEEKERIMGAVSRSELSRRLEPQL